MASHIRFKFDDDDDEYQPTDSEDELTTSEKRLLLKARNKGPSYSDSEEEVFGLPDDSAEDDDDADDQSDIALSDVEGQGEDDYGIPDAKAWGKNKRHYYSTDYVDPDYGGFQGKDATLAELEEEEARNIQRELAKSLDDDDFALDFMPKEQADAEKPAADVIKTDISQLSKRQKLQLLQRESPELFQLIEDYKVRVLRAKDDLYPVIALYREAKIEKSFVFDFFNMYYQIILNYIVNVNMYLLLKADKKSLQNHPVIKRLYQYRQMLVRMDPLFEEEMKPRMDKLLAIASTGDTAPVHKKQKLLGILKASLQQANSEKQIENPNKRKVEVNVPEDKSEEKAGKRVKFNVQDSNDEEDEDDLMKENGTEIDNNGEDDGEMEEQEVGKRGITYQIAKNKGLTPHRKKEQRNPRVKHRNKFRKAQIRRKGAVREVRRESTRYGGEVSGIKASVSKSIKIK